MNPQYDEIWNETLNLIKDELTEVSFNTWLKSITPISADEKTFTLYVPEDFTKGIIETRYSSLIKNALSQTTGKEYNIRFTITKNEEKLPEQDTFQNEGNLNYFLNPRYTFNTFVIGNSNRLAHAASVAVAESPAKAYNPLFIYGGVGLGKTHLMHAIGHYILNQTGFLKIMYVSAETFTNELIDSIRDYRNIEFRNKYRSVDILLMDDIQFIAGKERTQEEFFHTFNTLYEANKQIVISSDRPPKDILTLEDRLRSRFEWGLLADIQAPDLETRIAILRMKAKLENLKVPDDVLTYIGTNILSNIRELEGALNRVIAYSTLYHREITEPMAMEALKDILSGKKRLVTADLIKEHVGEYFNVKLEDFNAKKRTRSIVYPRQIAMFLCREMTDLSLPKIGEEFGRDHTTILHAYDKISAEVNADTQLKLLLDELKNKISGK